MDVLCEYAIHGYRSRKKSPIERYREQHQPPPGSEIAYLLDSMEESLYSVFLVEGSEGGYLCQCKDPFSKKAFRLVDSGLGGSSSHQLLIASRVMAIPGSDCFMTTGAPIPVIQPSSIREIEQIIRKFFSSSGGGLLSPSRQANLSRQVIRTLLRAGETDKIVYR